MTILLCLPLILAARSPFSFKPVTRTNNHSLLYIKLHYANGNKIIKLIRSLKSDLLSPKGKIIFSPQNRMLIVSDNQSQHSKLINLVHRLDSETPQVIIQATIINIDKDYARKLGLSMFQGNIKNSPSTLDQFNIPLLGLTQDHLLNLKLNLLERQGHATIIATPLLFTLNNQPATIESGSEIPYQQYNKNGGTNVSFKKAVLRLNVIPSVLPKSKLLLEIQVNQDSLSSLSVNGEPAIKTQNLNTKVILKNHETVILGGIFNQTDSHYVNGIPIVKDIPILGHLFQTQHTIKQKKELLLIMTPTIEYNS